MNALLAPTSLGSTSRDNLRRWGVPGDGPQAGRTHPRGPRESSVAAEPPTPGRVGNPRAKPVRHACGSGTLGPPSRADTFRKGILGRARSRLAAASFNRGM